MPVKCLFLVMVFLLATGIPFADAQRQPILPDTAQAHQLYFQAISLQNKGQDSPAYKLYAQAAGLYQKHGLWARHFDCYNQMALALLHLGKYEEALQKAGQVIRESTARLGKANAKEATACQVMGRVYKEKGDYDKALAYYQQVLQIRLKVHGPAHHRVGTCYQHLGTLYLEKGEYDKSLEYLLHALQILMKAVGEVHPDVAVAYLNIANIFDRKGETGKAHEYYQKAFDLWRQTQVETVEEVNASYHNIGGGVYYKKGEYDKALACYQKALQIRRRTLGEVHEDVADSYIYIGRVYNKMGDYDQALDYFQTALQIRCQLFGEVHAKVADAYGNIGRLYRNKGEYDRALESHQQAWRIRNKYLNRNHPLMAIAHNNIGELYRLKGENDKALWQFQQALLANIPSFRDSGIYHNPVLSHKAGSYLDGMALFSSLVSKAAALEWQYQRSQALPDLLLAYQTYCAADTLAQQIQHGYTGERDQVAFTAKAMTTYQQALPLCLQLHALTKDPAYLVQAFHYAERDKANVLLASLAESKARAFAGIPDSLLQQDQQLRIRAAHYHQLIAQELAQGQDLDSSKLISYQSQLFALQRQQESLVTSFEKDFPDYFGLKYQRAMIAPAQLQKVLNDKTAVLEYVLTDTTLHQFTITRKSFAIRSVALDSLFRRQLTAFREAILARDEDLLQQVGYRLYQVLLPPSLPASIRQLVIIPGGELGAVPFEALLRQDPNRSSGKPKAYLLHQYAVSYAYSARLLYERLVHPEAAGRAQLLALAPVFADTQAAVAATAAAMRSAHQFAAWQGDSTYQARQEQAIRASGGRVPTGLPDSQYVVPLLASRREVETIGRLFRAKGALARVYLDGQAREEQLKNTNLSAYQYLHLATHGFVNERYPELSGLLLAQDSAKGEDGILYTGEIYNLRLKANLVTLSACETGLGKIAPGEGVIGLTRALLYAGAQNILVSLWKVYDVSTADLMAHFYKTLLSGQDNARALQVAKQKLVRQGKYSQPYYWAPFILVGK